MIASEPSAPIGTQFARAAWPLVLPLRCCAITGSIGKTPADAGRRGRYRQPERCNPRRPDASPDRRPRSEPPDRRRPALCRSARPPDGGVDAQLDRYRRSRAGRRARADRRRAPLRRGARHQVRDVRGATGPRRDDRRAAPRRVAARRAPPAARARSGARNAAPRAGTRAVARRSGRPRRLRRKASEPDDRSHQHDRIDVAAGDRRTLRRKLRCRRRWCRPSPMPPTPPTRRSKCASGSARRFSRCRGASTR